MNKIFLYAFVVLAAFTAVGCSVESGSEDERKERIVNTDSEKVATVDKFDEIKESCQMRTEKKYEDFDGMSYMVQTNRVFLKLPKQLAGMTDEQTKEVVKSLVAISKEKGILPETSGTDVKKIVSSFLSKPWYDYETDMPARCVPSKEKLDPTIGCTEDVWWIYPVTATDRFIEFAVGSMSDSGSGFAAGVSDYTYYVTIPRERQDGNKKGYLTFNDILKKGTDREVLNAVNAQIQEEIDFRDMPYSLAEELPEDVKIGKKGLSFYFPKYTIGPGAAGVGEITVPYSSLERYMSSSALKLIKSAKDWVYFEESDMFAE